MTPTRALGTRLRVEQVRLLYANLPAALTAALINGFILFIVQWETVSRASLALWLGAICAVTLFRFGTVAVFRRGELTPANISRWSAWFMFGAVLSAGVWGSAGMVLFPEELANQIFVIFVLAGIAAGAVVSYSAQLSVALMFVVLALTPLTTRLIIEGHNIHFAMGTMSSLFLLMMVITARRMYGTTLMSLRLRFENQELIDRLARENAETDGLNKELNREIRERARVERGLRESEARTRAVLDNVPDGIITLTEEGVIESINPAAVHIFGYVHDEVVGRHFKMLMPESHRDEYDDYVKAHVDVANHKMIGFGMEITGQRRDGSEFPMELGMREMRLDEQRRFIGIVRDITERREAERAKNRFMAAVSHELRTPLTSVLGSLGLLAEGIGGELSERGKSLLNIARNNIERLSRLIGDILDIDEIHLGRLTLDVRRLDLMRLLDRVVQGNRHYAAGSGVRLVITHRVRGAVIGADAGRLAHALNHLISNAIKYSPSGASVEVAVTSREDTFRISVRDHGPGIPERFHERVFQPFFRTDMPIGRDRGGTGLGLSIARAITEKHGGRIGLESRDGSGACFYIELPKWQDDAAKQVMEPAHET